MQLEAILLYGEREQESTMAVVWILGAGFSRPLGAPLLGDLISPAVARDLGTWPEYAQLTSGDHSAAICAQAVQMIYDTGGNHLHDVMGEQTRGYGLWDDPEQFLERVEIAAADNASQLHAYVSTIPAIGFNTVSPLGEAYKYLTKDPARLHRESVRFVAGACSHFLARYERNPELVSKAEVWAPYRRWHQQLEGGDSIVTFNYDRVVDLLESWGKAAGHNVHFARPVPFDDVDSNGVPDLFRVRRKSHVGIFNLHGHVSWLRGADGELSIRTTAEAHRHPGKAVLGIPGAGKSELTNGYLKVIWDLAIQRIEEADAIAFVGYRFPPTDNEAKERILSALAGNAKGKDALCHIVLRENNPDTPRLKSLLRWVASPPINHELRTEDFFSAFTRELLHDRKRWYSGTPR